MPSLLWARHMIRLCDFFCSSYFFVIVLLLHYLRQQGYILPGINFSVLLLAISQKNYSSDIHENCKREVSFNKEKLVKFQKSSAYRSGSRNFLKILWNCKMGIFLQFGSHLWKNWSCTDFSLDKKVSTKSRKIPDSISGLGSPWLRSILSEWSSYFYSDVVLDQDGPLIIFECTFNICTLYRIRQLNTCWWPRWR